jgi:hypothetical protein
LLLDRERPDWSSAGPNNTEEISSDLGGARVIYRMRVYDTVRENLQVFHEFFRDHLLPVQLRHGARLVGRWETDDGQVVAIWEYDDHAAYEGIDAAVRQDPDSRRAQQRRAQLPPIIRAQEETFMRLAPDRGVV